MKAGKAFLAGVAGGAVMSALLWMARMLDMPANLEMWLGTMLGLELGVGTFVIGLMMHLVISGLIALIYAWGFESVTHRAGWLVGAGFAVIHAIIGGLVMAMMPALHPQMPGLVEAPGAFMSNIGTIGVIAFVMMHIIYGAVVGAIYEPVVHSRDRVEVHTVHP